MLKIQILIDNRNSWIIPYGQELLTKLKAQGHNVLLIHDHTAVEKGDILCLLSCEKIFKNLSLNKHNLVVHESDLPKGKGWSPVTWQVLEGANKIPVTLLEAADKIDSGVIYKRKYIELEGTELINDIREQQGKLTIELIMDFVQEYPNVKGVEQTGESSYYPQRTPVDSELNINRTILENFNLLRVSDNERYPAYFIFNNQKYYLKIYKQ